jgi:hypothetical protein
MSTDTSIDQLDAEARHYRERLSLLRAKMYRGGVTSGARLRELERSLLSAEHRLHEARARQAR